MKHLLALCFRRQEADSYMKFNTKDARKQERKAGDPSLRPNCRSPCGKDWEIRSEWWWETSLAPDISTAVSTLWGSGSFWDPSEQCFCFLPKMHVHPSTHTCMQSQGIPGHLQRLSNTPQASGLQIWVDIKISSWGLVKKQISKPWCPDLLIQSVCGGVENFHSNNFPGAADAAGLKVSLLEALPSAPWNTELVGTNVQATIFRNALLNLLSLTWNCQIFRKKVKKS